MTKIQPENLWFNEVARSDDEELILSYPANHTQGKRAVGGKLFVTNLRIAFAPNRMEAGMGGMTMERPLAEISSIGTEKPRHLLTEIFSGAWRTRLSIFQRSDEVDFFVVENPKAVAEAIRNAIETLRAR